MLRNLMVATAMDKSITSKIEQVNYDYLKDANFIMPMSNELEYMHKTNIKTALHGESLRTFMATRMKLVNDDDLVRLFAKDITPADRVYTLANPQIAYTEPTSLMILFEFSMFSMTHPGLFEIIKGDIQNEIMKLASLMYPSEYLHYQDSIGFAYKMVGTEKKRIQDIKKWQQSYYLSDVRPSFWDLENNRRDVLRLIPNLVKIRKLFRTVGIITKMFEP